MSRFCLFVLVNGYLTSPNKAKIFWGSCVPDQLRLSWVCLHLGYVLNKYTKTIDKRTQWKEPKLFLATCKSRILAWDYYNGCVTSLLHPPPEPEYSNQVHSSGTELICWGILWYIRKSLPHESTPHKNQFPHWITNLVGACGHGWGNRNNTLSLLST